jgi:hypothetical protein
MFSMTVRDPRRNFDTRVVARAAYQHAAAHGYGHLYRFPALPAPREAESSPVAGTGDVSASSVLEPSGANRTESAEPADAHIAGMMKAFVTPQPELGAVVETTPSPVAEAAPVTEAKPRRPKRVLEAAAPQRNPARARIAPKRYVPV